MQHGMSAPGTSRTSRDVRLESAKWAEADIDQVAAPNRAFMSARPSASYVEPLSSPGAVSRSLARSPETRSFLAESGLFRSAPRTCRPFCGRLSERKTAARGGRRPDVRYRG